MRDVSCLILVKGLLPILFISKMVSYLGKDGTFLCGLHEVYSHIMVSPDLFLYLFLYFFMYLFIYLSTRVERLSRGLV